MKVTELSPAQARQLLQERGGEENFVVLDVRTPGEFAAGHLVKAQNMEQRRIGFYRPLAGVG
jgi:rhodanese-related sulfurtransferase